MLVMAYINYKMLDYIWDSFKEKIYSFSKNLFDKIKQKGIFKRIFRDKII